MAQSKHAEARELMCSGALLFFSHGQQNSAADLSMLVLESLEKAEVEVADELLESLAKLFSLMWSVLAGRGPVCTARSWPLPRALSAEQNYCESRYHFLHSSDGEGCANMLVEYSTARGFRSEVDMFVAQAVLQFLCLKNKSSASVVFTTYTQKHPSIEGGPPFVQPLLNFIWFLLLAVDGGKLTVFTVLCEQYQPSQAELLGRVTLSAHPPPTAVLRPARPPAGLRGRDLRVRVPRACCCWLAAAPCRVGLQCEHTQCKLFRAHHAELGAVFSSLTSEAVRFWDSLCWSLERMGSSEQEGEDSQDDSSPIELD
nr:PREDICTED: Golgi to ER traffic protein 4 homolog [Bos mutus]